MTASPNPSARGSRTFKGGLICLDTTARLLVIGGSAAKLGGRAFDLLEALADRRDRVVAKQELMDLVWPGLVVEENNLQVHVAALRKLIGSDAIATVSGRGYRFTLTPDDDDVRSAGTPATPSTPRTIPPGSALLGRGDIAAMLVGMFERKEVRLVTLTGPGGSGKTRLGLYVAAQLAPRFVDGSFTVMLAPVREPDSVASAIASVLGLQESGALASTDLVLAHLANRNALLMLDNFEHVQAAAPVVARLLEACPGVSMLITSRSPLRLPGESDVVVPPLQIPGAEATPVQVAHFDAVRLFTQRAVEAGRPTATQDFGTIAEICRKLDGLPLAIELAAARLKVLSPQALLTRLDHRLELLKSGQPQLPERQRTLRNAIAWSYELLAAEEKSLFRQFSVFVGGWSLQAAEAVAVAEPSHVVIDILERLVDQSLIQRIEDVSGEPRFTMLETVREYAVEQLQSSGEYENVRQRHAAFYAELAARAEPELTSPQREEALVLLRTELNNLRAALAWHLSDRPDGAAALRLAGRLPWFWYFAGLLSEGRRVLKAALTLDEGKSEAVSRARALSGASRLATYSGDMAEGIGLAAQSVQLWRETGDQRGLAFALFHQSIPSSIARHQSARELIDESLACFRKLDDTWGIALTTSYLGTVLALTPGLEREARLALIDGHARFAALGDDWGSSLGPAYLAIIATREGKTEEARAYCKESLQTSRWLGDNYRVSRGLHMLAEVEALDSRPDVALSHLKESLLMTREQGRLGDVAQLLRLAARLETIRKNYVVAGQLFAAAARLAAEHKALLPPDSPQLTSRALEEIQTALGEAGFASASAFGSTMTPDQAIRAITTDSAKH